MQPRSNVTVSAPPLDPLSTALLTDMYQITMAYSYWFNERHNGVYPTVHAGPAVCLIAHNSFARRPCGVRPVLPKEPIWRGVHHLLWA